jgi:hypothetical protein
MGKESKKEGKLSKKNAKTDDSPPLGLVHKTEAPSARTKGDRSHHKSARPIFTWIRGAIGPTMCIVGAGMIFSSFNLGVFLIYGGGLVFIIEVLFDPWMRKYLILYRFLGIVIVLCLLTEFSTGVVFVNAPLNTMVSIHRTTYAPGTIIAGIKWRSEFTDLRMSLSNNTENDYREVDLYIEPNEPIALIGQLSTVPGVSLMGDLTKEQVEVGGMTFGPPGLGSVLLGEDGRPLSVPINIPLTQASAPRYRVRCQSIIKKSGIELVLAIAGVDCNNTQCLKITWISDDSSLKIPSPTLIPSTDYNKDIFVRRQPSQVKIYGTYMGGKPPRTMSIKETVFIKEPIRVQ